MRFAISSHKHWLILLLAAFIVVTPTVYAQDDFYDEDGQYGEEDLGGSWIRVKAKGSTLKGAIARGWKIAMMKFLKNNIDSEYYEGRNN